MSKLILKTTFFWVLRILLGFLVIYIKLPIDLLLYALYKLGFLREKTVNYDRHWVFMKLEDVEISTKNTFMKLFVQVCAIILSHFLFLTLESLFMTKE